jgi:hypothetical protein
MATTGSLPRQHGGHTATLLPNGKVLIAAGYDTNLAMARFWAELYDPVNGTWKATGDLATARFYHTATLLPNGKVLVVGGFSHTFQPLASAELYDPVSGTWTATGSLATARYSQTASLLPNGKVLIAGGYAVGGTTASAELSPCERTSTPTGPRICALPAHGNVAPNGKVLIAGVVVALL